MGNSLQVLNQGRIMTIADFPEDASGSVWREEIRLARGKPVTG